MEDEEHKKLPLVTVQGAVIGVILVGVMILVFYKSAESYMQRGWAFLWHDVSYRVVAPLATIGLGTFLGIKVEKMLRILIKGNTISAKLSALADLFSAKAIAIFLIGAAVVSYYVLTGPKTNRHIYLLYAFFPIVMLDILRFIFFIISKIFHKR
jgi:hypothetical protein